MGRGLQNKMRKAVAVCVAAVLLATVGIVPQEIKAADGSADEVQYVKVSYDTFKALIDKQEAPIYEEADYDYGYLFGGWYADANEETPIQASDEVKSGTDVYAKYVPAYVMGIKCQNHYQAATSDTTSMRVVSSVDSAMYSEVGMSIRRITLGDDGSCEKVTEIGEYVAKAYAGNFSIYDSQGEIAASYSPKQIFGSQSEYFTAVRLINISNYDLLICIRPYWITLDGTKVEGLTRYIRVNDGVQGYVSIPINLKSANDIAAGLVTVDYSALAEDGYTLYAVENGTVFGEMESGDNADGHLLTYVGNVTDITSNAASDDILVNLRFKAPEGAARSYTEDSFYSITVTKSDFTNIEEDTFNGYTVWNVQY